MIREYIALLFKVAREEGALRKWANGESDAEEVINLIVDKLTVMSPREISMAKREARSGQIVDSGNLYEKAVIDAQLQHTIKEIKGGR